MKVDEDFERKERFGKGAGERRGVRSSSGSRSGWGHGVHGAPRAAGARPSIEGAFGPGTQGATDTTTGR